MTYHVAMDVSRVVSIVALLAIGGCATPPAETFTPPPGCVVERMIFERYTLPPGGSFTFPKEPAKLPPGSTYKFPGGEQ